MTRLRKTGSFLNKRLLTDCMVAAVQVCCDTQIPSQHQSKNRHSPVRWIGVPTGSRTPVAAVKGRCPRPLDDGDGAFLSYFYTKRPATSLLLDWWSQAGSNRRPLQCHCSALPAELWPHELPIHCLPSMALLIRLRLTPAPPSRAGRSPGKRHVKCLFRYSGSPQLSYGPTSYQFIACHPWRY